MYSLFLTHLSSQNEINNYHLLSSNTSQSQIIHSKKTENLSEFRAIKHSISQLDTTRHNNDNLLNDDPDFNKRYSLWKPALEVTGINALTWVFGRYALKTYYTKVGFNSWKRNLKSGWIWDTDRLGIDFFAHPLSGAMCYNAARSSGYTFTQSFPYAILGSVEWKYFGENGPPTTNDLITTSLGGLVYGEILYRLSSNILDDRTVGTERILREIFAGLVDPVRGVNRLIQGKTFRVTTKEVYQKEYLNAMIGGGIQKINDGTAFGTGPTSGLVNLNIAYGNPFEKKARKPFDYFETNILLDNGDLINKRILDNISAYGLLCGKNVQKGKMNMLFGIFQHYDYFNNNTFELANLTFSGGILSQYPVGSKSYLNTNFHLGIVPFGGYSVIPGPDTSQLRAFNYGGGLGAKFQTGLNICDRVNIKFSAMFYWMTKYAGISGNNLIGIIEPSILFRIYKNLHLGLEYFLYTNDKYADKPNDFDIKNAEQKFVLLYKFENNKHSK